MKNFINEFNKISFFTNLREGTEYIVHLQTSVTTLRRPCDRIVHNSLCDVRTWIAVTVDVRCKLKLKNQLRYYFRILLTKKRLTLSYK